MSNYEETQNKRAIKLLFDTGIPINIAKEMFDLFLEEAKDTSYSTAFERLADEMVNYKTLCNVMNKSIDKSTCVCGHHIDKHYQGKWACLCWMGFDYCTCSKFTLPVGVTKIE